MACILELQDIKKYFRTPGGLLHAVDGISFKQEAGTTLGVVGESGCGKSTLGYLILHLLNSSGGKMFYEGKDVTILSKKELIDFRQKVRIIFQDPYSSLNPRMTVFQTIKEPLQIRGGMSGPDMEKETLKLMDTVGLASRYANSYPHELDGGRRQRIGIARALALNPNFIVCDEPVSALDVSIQAQVINLMLDLQEELKLTYIFITHDLSVVKYISNDIMVMYLGQMVEKAEARELFTHTYHPYTKALLSAIPIPDVHAEQKRILLRGEITSPINPKPGCRFASRCIYAREECNEKQTLEKIEPGHFIACCRAREINGLN